MVHVVLDLMLDRMHAMAHRILPRRTAEGWGRPRFIRKRVMERCDSLPLIPAQAGIQKLKF
jgi:hypothetical protein